MIAGPGTARIAAGRVAVAGALALPFVFGGVDRSAWQAAAVAFLACGVLSLLGLPRGSKASPFGRVFAALHVICALQLTPLPTAVLRALSPGSFFLAAPDAGPAAAAWPITVSRAATLDAWLWIAGLHALHAAAARWFDVEPRARRGALLALAVAATCLSAEALLQRTGPQPEWLYGVVPIENPGEKGIMGPFYNRNAYSAIASVGATLSLAFAVGSTRVSVYLLGASGFLLGAVGIGVGGSRAGLLALLIGSGVALSSVARARPRMARAGLAAVVIAAGLSLTFGWPLSVQRFSTLDLEVSRLNAWADMLRILRWFPLFGHGLGAFGEAYRPYQSNEVYEYWPHAHNDFLEFLLEAGALGTVAAVFLTLRACVRVAREGTEAVALPPLAAVAVLACIDFPVRLPAAAAWLVILLAAAARGAAVLPDGRNGQPIEREALEAPPPV